MTISRRKTADDFIADAPIDFAIITAIEVERRAVCRIFKLTDRDRNRKGSRVYWRGSLSLKEGGVYQIVVAQSPDAANVDAALLTLETIHHWNPAALLMVGIAGAASDDVALGDVIIGSDVYYYERGKETPDGKKPEPKSYRPDATLWNNATTVPDWKPAISVRRPDGKKNRPKLHQGVIASGEKVIADAAIRDQIVQPNRKIMAIEMEGYGFSAAVWQSFDQQRHLVIRAISDAADRDKKDDWQSYAAAAAANFAKHFLCDQPLPPRNNSKPQQKQDEREEEIIPVVPSASRLNQLPSDLADFTGRDKEVKELMKALAQGEGRIAISAIGGMGGVGKSVLAVHVAHQLVDRYPAGQIVVDMQGTSDRPLTAIEAMARVIQAFHPEARVADDVNQVAQDYRNLLAGKHALILLDNAANATQVRPLVPSPPCALIITSRRTIVIAGVRSGSLDALSEKDARDLLREIVGKSRATNKQLDAIAELCGRLPLALRIAGTFLAKYRDWTVAEYIETLADERKRLAHLKQDDLDVEVTLALSARQLELENSELAAHWKLLSVFPADFDRAAAAAIWNVIVEEARDSLSALLERSLVLYDEEGARYRLHDLVRLFTDAQLSEAERAAGQQRHASHYKTVLDKVNEFYLQGGEALKQGLTIFDLEWRNIQAGQVWAASNVEKDDAAAELCSNYSTAGVYLLLLRQHPRGRIRWLEAALSATRRLKKRSIEGRHLGSLGMAYADLGETWCAIEYHEQHLVIAREIGDRRGEGIALGNLGIAYAALNEMRRAIEYYQQALIINREIGYRRNEGNALGNLGLAYRNLGEMHRAIDYHKQHLAIAREIGDRRGEGNALGSLGLACAVLGETRRAIEYYEQHLAIAREIGDRRGEGTALFNMSFALDQFGDRAQAILNVEAALKIYEQIESPYADRARNQLAEWRGHE
ncbi:MAG TPA: tetratricopeptide repeat protein [Blastocatellia bacterium]|nr:tetratricopeptide repeat protein [Blastocatellia bacterium]